MYNAYFGFSESPFSIAPDPRYLYMSERHREALAHLLYGVGGGGGFVLLTGEVGTGKTTVCRCLLEQMPAQVDLALILNPKLSPTELVAAICDELHVAYDKDSGSLKTLVDALNQRLLAAHAEARSTVVIIDEAQQLSVETLEQLRLLTNLETNTKKLLQVILIGQPELQSILTRQELRQLAQRVIARYHLLPLSVPEIAHYIGHRLAVAGSRQSLFPNRVIKRLHQLTGGVPRLINTLCDRSLLGAYARGKRVVDVSLINEAAREVLGLSRRLADEDAASARGKPVALALRWSLGLAALAGLAIAGHQFWPAPGLVAQTVSPPAASPAAEPAKPALATGLEARLDPAKLDRSGYGAYGQVFARWGRPYDARSQGLPCAYAISQGLRCHSRSGDWVALRQLNLPAVLKLYSPSQGFFYAALLGMSDSEASVELAGQKMTVPVHELAPYWQGDFTLLWQAPPAFSGSLNKGSRGPAVSWLRARLDSQAGRAENPAPPDVYDEAVAGELRQFQATQGLRADGIAGEQTLVLLSQQVNGTPRLDEPSAGGEPH
ncbi:MAG: AAA family ATPase [Gammaproteobacteria bacterium]|nr:AAA family ATPase [Gammaproteobacteria bacterium]